MRHLAIIQREFLKSAVAPSWWGRLNSAEQRAYLKTHPGSSLRPTWPIKNINGIRVRKLNPELAEDTQYIGTIDAPKMQLIKLFGRPNFRTKKHGDEWIISVGGRIVTIYGGEKTGGRYVWHVGGFNNTALQQLQTVLARPEVTEISRPENSMSMINTTPNAVL